MPTLGVPGLGAEGEAGRAPVEEIARYGEGRNGLGSGNPIDEGAQATGGESEQKMAWRRRSERRDGNGKPFPGAVRSAQNEDDPGAFLAQHEVPGARAVRQGEQRAAFLERGGCGQQGERQLMLGDECCGETVAAALVSRKGAAAQGEGQMPVDPGEPLRLQDLAGAATGDAVLGGRALPEENEPARSRGCRRGQVRNLRRRGLSRRATRDAERARGRAARYRSGKRSTAGWGATAAAAAAGKQGLRIELEHVDVVVGAEVIVLALRDSDGEQRGVVREHGEVAVAAVRGKVRIALLEHRPAAPGGELEGIDRTAGACRPDREAAVVREGRLAATERGPGGDAALDAPVGEGRCVAGREFATRRHEPALAVGAGDGEPGARAGRQPELACGPLSVEMHQLVLAPPDRRAMLAEVAGLGDEHPVPSAVGVDQMKLAGVLGVLAGATREAEVDQAAAVR